MHRLFTTLLVVAAAAVIAIIPGSTASAQANCPSYTVRVDPSLAPCLPLSLTTFWGNPASHNASITTTGITVVPAPPPFGIFFAPFNGVSVNGGPVIPGATPTTQLLLPCNLCATIHVIKDPATGCIVINIFQVPGPC